MVYNRNWLKDQIKGYLHDASVDAHLDTWIDLGAKRVSQIMQCDEMEGSLFRAEGSSLDYMIIDNTVRHILGVQWKNFSGQWINLRSVPRHAAGQYKRTGTPCVYLIENRTIIPLPSADADYRAQIIAEVIIPDTPQLDTPALSAYPFVFLNAALAEAYDWKQNPDMVARYEDKWSTEAREITKNYMNERVGDTPAMRAM